MRGVCVRACLVCVGVCLCVCTHARARCVCVCVRVELRDQTTLKCRNDAKRDKNDMRPTPKVIRQYQHPLGKELCAKQIEQNVLGKIERPSRFPY